MVRHISPSHNEQNPGKSHDLLAAIGTPNRSRRSYDQRVSFGRRRAVTAAATVLAPLMLFAAARGGQYSERKAQNDAQPECVIPVEYGYNQSVIDNAITEAGDDVHGSVRVFDSETGSQLYVPPHRLPFREAGAGVEVRVDHVSQEDCEEAQRTLEDMSGQGLIQSPDTPSEAN